MKWLQCDLEAIQQLKTPFSQQYHLKFGQNNPRHYIFIYPCHSFNIEEDLREREPRFKLVWCFPACQNKTLLHGPYGGCVAWASTFVINDVDLRKRKKKRKEQRDHGGLPSSPGPKDVRTTFGEGALLPNRSWFCTQRALSPPHLSPSSLIPFPFSSHQL